MTITDISHKTEVVKFVVYGRPQQRGSKVAMVRYGRDGKPITKNGRVLTFAMDANKQSASWMEQVRSMAAAEYGLGRELLASPLCLYADFYFSRPQSHYGVKGIKKSAPLFHTQTPDIDKLARCLCDAITGVVWKDDRYVTMAVLNKHWTQAQERVEVSIYAS